MSILNGYNYKIYGIAGNEHVRISSNENELSFISAQDKVLHKIAFVDDYKEAQRAFDKCCRHLEIINDNKKIISAIENSNIAHELKPQISEEFYNNVTKAYMYIEKIFGL